MPSVFLDSNIFLYAALPPKNDAGKGRIAPDLLKTTDFGVSSQTLAEVYGALARLRDPVIDEAEIELWIVSLAEQPLAPVDALFVRRGVELSRRYRIGYFDTALIAAAERLGAETFNTEDPIDGQDHGAVVAINPCKEAAR